VTEEEIQDKANLVACINDAPKPTTLNSTHRKATLTKTRVRSVITGQVRVWKRMQGICVQANHHTGACNLIKELYVAANTS
jgi:hypothetical protein